MTLSGNTRVQRRYLRRQDLIDPINYLAVGQTRLHNIQTSKGDVSKGKSDIEKQDLDNKFLQKGDSLEKITIRRNG
jgi:hypothetical protein